MTSPTRIYRGLSADERRLQRRRRLIDGCLDVVLAEGTMQTTVDKVCAAAGLTKRYFYESFTDLDTLLLAAADELFDRLYADMVRAAEEHTTRPEQWHAVLTSVVGALDADPRGARLYVECPGHTLLRARREEAISAFTNYLFRNLLEPGEASLHRLFQTRLLVAGATDLITGHLSGSIPATTADVVEAVTAMAKTI